MRLFNLLALMTVCLFCSCNNSAKISSIETKQKTLVKDSINRKYVYNSVLEILLKSNINYAVLEDKGIKLQLDYRNNRIDSLAYLRLKDKLQNKIIANDSLKNDLFLVFDNKSDFSLEIDFLDFSDYFKSPREEILKTMEQSISIDFSELKSSFVNLKKDSVEIQKPRFRRNTLYFSDIYFSSDHSYGALYYGFGCSSKCGHGAILIIKKEGENWLIEKTITLYEI